jgi:hypothetical protein
VGLKVCQLYKDFWSWRKPSRAKLFKDEPILTQNTQLLTQANAKVQSQVFIALQKAIADT